MNKTTYTEKLQPLLKLGDLRNVREWADYAGRFGLTAEDEPELLRMVEDEDLTDRKPNDPAVWAPIHALRALSQVGTERMIEPLLNLLDDAGDDDWLCEDIPHVLGALGKPALAPVEAFLPDQERDESARFFLVEFYQACHTRHPGLRSDLVNSARSLLADFDQNSSELNGFLVSALLHLRATEALTTIRLAYLSQSVDEMICGDYEEVRAAIESKV